MRGGLTVLLLVALLPGTARAGDGERGPSHSFRGPAEVARGERLPEEMGIGMVVTPGDEHRQSRIQGASLAIDQATGQGGWQGVPFVLRVGKVVGPWGTAAEEARDLLFQGDCVALITPPDRAVSHLLEQVAARGHVPLISLSGDSSLTRVPVPWLVRIVPDHRAEMGALIRALSERPEGPIPAFVPAGREGRAVRGDLEVMGDRLGVTFDPVIEFGESGPSDPGALPWDVRSGPVLVWLTGPAARSALGLAARGGWSGPVLLPRACLEGKGGLEEIPRGLRGMAVRLFDPSVKVGPGGEFAGMYRETFGTDPDEAAATAYDAAALLIEAVRQVGPNRSAIRDWLVRPVERHGVTGRLRFDGTGNREWEGVELRDSQGALGLIVEPEERPRGEEMDRGSPGRAGSFEEGPFDETRQSGVSLQGTREKGR